LHHVKIGTNGSNQIVYITLQLIEKPEAIKGTIIVVFNDVTNIPKPTNRKIKKLILI
jgi:two-component system, chemotaxis family, CheB/CheR fusion protein